ncbi:LINE-1 retrotransposable element ORF2 protein [Vitis vinifera]|uniref:LINE-1 retrotransposable element ORF2 protein n=1 Tax=Vitis vinifera TaxID=29760 RepID=A0A438CEZ3_VITVI|nr:LINE-1 retrotransposable element ORF2 protein [Vitis vinifera]
MDQKEDFTQGEKTMDSREMWSKLFLPSADRRHGQRSSSETLPLRSAASFSEGHNLEVDGGMGSHQTRGIRESPIFRCLLPRNCNSWSKEETSTSRGVMESRKSQLKEDKGGFTGRAGYDPGSSSVTVSPSIPRTRGKDIILGGNCEVPGVESLEVSHLFLLSHPSLISPSCNLAMNLPCPSGPHLPYSEILSQSPSVNQGKFKIFPEIGDVGPLNFVGIPVHVEEENQRAVFNQMSESSTPGKSSNLMPGSPGVNEASPPEDFLIDGLSPGKWLKYVRSYALWTLSWNVRGLGSSNKRRVIKDFLRLEKPDVVMIQETKKEKCDRRLVGSVWTVRNKDWVFSPACGASGGILFIWDSKKLSKEEVVLGSFSISVKFALEGCGPLWISAVYGPNSPSLRKDFWVELYDICGLTFPLWCVGGDFNVIRRSSEKLGGSRLTSSMRDFDSFISESELLDPPLRNASFTWSNMQESPVCKRLDRFLYSNEWGQLFPQGIQETLIRRTSDHWPIALDTNPFTWGPTPFRFENMWLQHPSFKENFRNWWRGFQGNGWEGHKFMRRLQFVKAKAKEWNKLSFGVLNEKKKSILKDLANLDAIEQDGGLTSELLEEEISKAIFQMDRDKAPGPDGFTIAVFQDCWDVIKEDLVRVFAEFHRSGVINQSTNASFIVLLPKKSTTKKISDFRPISLITSLYKIIAKVLSGRLRGVLHETIHSTQGAFVQGRQIMDAVLIANEIVDERRRSGEEGVVFKIDFEKAYDHVRWDFLDQVLEKKGFSPKWRKWMNGCLSSVSYAVLVNGSAKGWVKASRGLRQGDPLSPFLFTLVADVLSRMLVRAEERNMLEGFRVGRNRTRVSHLQFADDTIFFSNTREEDLQTLKSLLLAFGHISGLKVNLDKSNIYGINLDHAHISRLAETLGCKASGWPILYLGLPLGGNPRAGGFWDPVIERISRRLDGWQKAYLSFGGRITLIQSCLTHMPWKWLWRYPREGSALWHQVILSIYGSHSNGWDANTIVRWSHRCPWKAISQVFQEFSSFTRFVVGNGERIRFWEDLCSCPTRPFSWNLNFRRNLSDSEIEDLEGLMRSLDGVHLSPSVFPSKFVWNSQIPFKVQSFIWLVAHKKVNTNDMLQVRRPYKALSPDICILCMKHGESADHIFLHCSLTIGLWHRLFQLAKMDWVPPRSILDMMYIKFNGFGSSKRGIALWQAANIALIRIVWRERMRGFLRIKQGIQSLYGTLLFSLLLFGPIVPRFLRGLPLMRYFLIG